ncbi:seminal metalloprotease 1-like [Bactrocera neohumeralis]|uniref:seminal metalloprotease 1-like n=1 Tax=Bactrocera neohumeralis TaxID=98809 RepID=UPI00216618FF|nr:seminal metalloprotease 1-like [Bactrocera neohumeralis]
MRTCLSLVVLLVFGTSLALPVDLVSEEDPELTAGYFEGDIVLDVAPRNGMHNTSLHWPNGIVYYKIWEGFFDQVQETIIKGAMKFIEDVSCIRFLVADDDQPYFVNITGNPGGCYSYLGFAGDIQKYNLEPFPINEGCFRIGTIMHEMLHTLGFYHMHSTFNRDEYVQILFENVKPSHLQNFNKYDKDMIEDFGEAYDYGSILHYSPLAFSANGEKTIEPLQEVAEGIMGQRVTLSEGDISKLNKMYNCAEKD